MLPLRSQYADIPKGAIGWRVGRGEEYAIAFYRWFKSLHAGARAAFAAQNPEPEDRAGYYDGMRA